MAKDINFETSTKEMLSSEEYFFDVSERMKGTLFNIEQQLSISNTPDAFELRDKAALPLGSAFSTKKISKDVFLRRNF